MTLFVDKQQTIGAEKTGLGALSTGVLTGDVQLTGSEPLFRVKVKSIQSAHLPQLKSKYRI